MRGSQGASNNNLYGPSIGQLLSQRGLGGGGVEDIELEDPEELAARYEPGSAGYIQLQLKRKRQGAIMKQILKNGGYGDLARMVNVRKGEE